MPNWCCTNYVIEGDKREVKDLLEKLESLEKMEKPLVENGFGKKWLGCVVALFGGDIQKIRCRGEFEALDYLEPENGDAQLSFFETSAWSEMSEVWELVCSRYKTLKYYFQAEEPGCGYAATNDKAGRYFPDKFCVQTEKTVDYIVSEKVLFETVKKHTGTEVYSIEDAEKAVEEYSGNNKNMEEGKWCSFYQFIMVD
jgi:hypothetical protein